jgi:hypothetical protein
MASRFLLPWPFGEGPALGILALVSHDLKPTALEILKFTSLFSIIFVAQYTAHIFILFHHILDQKHGPLVTFLGIIICSRETSPSNMLNFTRDTGQSSA